MSKSRRLAKVGSEPLRFHTTDATTVASTVTRPALPTANRASGRWCYMPTVLSSAEYMRIGVATIRFAGHPVVADKPAMP